MFAVIFEVRPRQDRFDDYLAIAGGLRPKLEAIEGFIANERFRSQRDNRWLLSLSTWRDEKALVRWRTDGEHHHAQEKGRFEVFADYHLRAGEVIADSELASAAAHRRDETEVGAAKAVTITELLMPDARMTASLAETLGLDPKATTLIDQGSFESITTPGKFLLLGSWRDAVAAATFHPAKPAGAKSMRHRNVRIIRDYGMFERREAPQFYPPVSRAGTADSHRH